MPTLLLTGFPGFLGSALLPRLLARREGARALCLVQPQHRATAERRLDQLAAEHPDLPERTRLIDGDLTEPGLGLTDPGTDPGTDPELAEVTEVWHLAAVYDLTVAAAVARRVNVGGTARVIELCRRLPKLTRLQYVSTCYVSGRYEGVFTEDMLVEGQTFHNHYEATKFAAEVLVREAMAEGLPATIYRPGIVVGDSRTGATQKLDGPYFIARFLARQPLPVAVLPAVDREVTASLVPRDFVIDAMDELSVLERSLGRTYALTDPSPPTNREVAELLAEHLGKRLVWAPVPLGLTRAALATVPGLAWLMKLPPELIDYFSTPTSYAVEHTTTDLAGTGLTCPAFGDYVGRLLAYLAEHPELDAAAMV